MKKLRSFITDNDGFSAKDFLMVLFAGAFLVEQVVIFFLSLLGDVNSESLTVIKSLDGIVLTIVGGVFSVQAVREFRNPKADDYNYEYENTTAVDEPVYAEDPFKPVEQTYPQK